MKRRYRIVKYTSYDDIVQYAPHDDWYELEIRRWFRWRPCDEKGYEETLSIGGYRFRTIGEARAAINDIASVSAKNNIERHVLEYWETIDRDDVTAV